MAVPPGIPATKDAAEDSLVRFSICFFANTCNSSREIPAAIGPCSMISWILSGVEEKLSARNLLRLTLTPGSWTEVVMTFSSANSFTICFSICCITVLSQRDMNSTRTQYALYYMYYTMLAFVLQTRFTIINIAFFCNL